ATARRSGGSAPPRCRSDRRTRDTGVEGPSPGTRRTGWASGTATVARRACGGAGGAWPVNILAAMSAPLQPSTPRIDAAAVQACLRRLDAAPAAPWLHAEVARRMAERLALVRLQPRAVVDWWSFLGGGAALLQQAYPKARRVIVEPTRALCRRSLEALQAPWWTPAHWRAPDLAVQHEDETVAPGAQLLWANMMLHAVPDPLALMTRWQRILAP